MKYNAFISYAHSADNKLAQALQTALHKFAKPWYKKRHLEIFRDESSLSASPHLWDNIVTALRQSEYLIILASTDSEQSKWVNKEVEFWLENKSLDTILIVLTEGDIKWDEVNNCFLNPDHNAIPQCLDDKFQSEPFYVDLRQSKSEDGLSLENPIFKKEILKLAAKLHNTLPIDLAGDEVTAHKKMMLLRNGAITLLVLFLIAALAAAGIANQNQNEALKQKKIAEDKTILADNNLKRFQELKKTSLGSKYQGGIVFQWNDNTGKHGVIAAEKDLPGLYDWKSADIACQTLNLNGYGDWFLPTREEISVLFANRHLVGGFDSGYYWSWTNYKGDSLNAFFQSFVHGDRLTTRKTKQMHVRAVRAF